MEIEQDENIAESKTAPLKEHSVKVQSVKLLS
jgi:hypothetical protein